MVKLSANWPEYEMIGENFPLKGFVSSDQRFFHKFSSLRVCSDNSHSPEREDVEVHFPTHQRFVAGSSLSRTF